MAAVPPGPVPAAAGIGLRFPHHHAVLEQRPAVGWMEVHPENYFGGGAAVAALEAVRRDWPVTLHGVGLSLGSAEGLDAGHLARLAALAARIEPGLISEHVAWSVAGGTYLADLLPLPMTEEALDVVCRNVETMQSALGRAGPGGEPVELPAVRARDDSGMGVHGGGGRAHRMRHAVRREQHRGLGAQPRLRPACLSARAAGRCGGRNPCRRPCGAPARRRPHAAHRRSRLARSRRKCGGCSPTALARFGPVPVLVEWDTRIPPLGVLAAEAARAQVLIEEAGHARAA